MEEAVGGSLVMLVAVNSGAILLLIILSALFSGSETALTTASRAKLHTMSEGGSRGARLALSLTEDKERLIGAILLGNNLVNILATSLATMLFTILLGETGVLAATLIMTALVLVFAEVMPKTYAIGNAEKMASRVSGGFTVVTFALAPVVNLVRRLVRFILRAVGVETDAKANFLSAQEEIADAITLHHFEGLVDKSNKDRLMGALDLGQRNVKEVMTHRSKLYMIDAALPPLRVLEKVTSSPHTRIPIYRDDPENIIGVVHAKDLLRAIHGVLTSEDKNSALEKFDVSAVAMEPYFIPETMHLDKQIGEFQKRMTHFALVVDEYGGLQGVVTLEDILEEIVGEIGDEHDPEVEATGRIVVKSLNEVEVEGTTAIRDINRDCGWRLPEDLSSTVAGLLIVKLEVIPSVGDVIELDGFRFSVLERCNNCITKVDIIKVAGHQPSEEKFPPDRTCDE